ncbi:MAG: cation transporting ATPase C-terminal domain-containing protein [Lachnotalea sp.]
MYIEIFEEKPRAKKESILTKNFLIGIIVEGLVIAIMTMSAYYVGLNNGGEATASTMAFATLCLSRLVPALRGVFKVVPLSIELLFTIYGLALANLVVIQTLKWVQTKIKRA